MLRRMKQAIGSGLKRIEWLQVGFGKLIQFKGSAGAFAQSTFHARGIEPPIYLKAVEGQTGVQAIAHIAIFRTSIVVADRAELGDVEISVGAE